MEVKLGTIGSGVIVHSVLDNVMKIDGIKLESVFSRSKEKAENLADEYKAQKIYTDFEKFLSDENINTIYIATPNLLHYEQAKKSLLSGKNVICEKPFVTKSSQAHELKSIAREKNLFIVEAAPTFFLPNFRILKRELQKIGKIKLIMSNYSQYSSRYDLVLKGEKPNIFNPEYAGGCLMDINFYNVLLNTALFGKPENAIYYPNIYPGLSDTSGVFLMQYENFVSQNSGAKDTWGVNFFQIEGEKGFIYIQDGSNGIKNVRVVTKTSDETFNEQPVSDRWYYEVKELTRLLLDEKFSELEKMLDVSISTVEVIESARKNAGIIFPGDSQ